MASVWEMGIKISLGKLEIGHEAWVFVRDHVVGNGMDCSRSRPACDTHRRDAIPPPRPVDRLLIAQALEEGV